jgi:DNA-binding transcriptional regulator YiaG
MGRHKAPSRQCDVCHQQAHLIAGHRTCQTCRVANAERRASRQCGGLTHREIAKLLGMSKSAVQVHERRAIEKLRAGLIRLDYDF